MDFSKIFENGLYQNAFISIVILIVGYIIRSIILKMTHKRIDDTKVYYRAKKTITYIYFLLVIALLLSIWIETGQITTYLGLLSAGLAIALKDLIINIAAWMFILLKKPFDVGDRIEINGVAGDVIDQRLFQFTVMEIGNWVSNDQSTGRIVHLPNSMVFSQSLANFTSGFEYIWNEVDVLLTFESDFKKAKSLFIKVADKHSIDNLSQVESEMKKASKRYMIYYNKLTPIVYTDVKDSGVMLSIRYLCKPHQRRNTNELIWEDLLLIFEENDDINLAYNTVRITKE